MQGSRSTKQAEGTDHTHQAKAMVAVKMGDENRSYFSKTDARTSQLHLRAFATIHEKELSPHLDNLCRSIVSGCGQSTATAKDMYPERLHVWLHEEFVLGVFQLYFLTVFFLGFLTAVLEGLVAILVHQ